MWMDFSTIMLRKKGRLNPADCTRYLLILRGQGTFSSRQHQIQLSRHDMFTLRADESAECEPAGSGGILLGCIAIHDYKSRPEDMQLLPADTTDLVRQIFYMGLDTQDNPLPYYDSVNAAIHQLMFSALIACSMQSLSIHPKVFQVIQQINEHFTEVDYDIRPVLEETGYTVNHFRKVFQQETGVTPAGYLINRRMDRAAELFDQYKDRVPIKEISLRCGYQDPYYFSRQFKKTFGMSPKQYIKELSG